MIRLIVTLLVAAGLVLPARAQQAAALFSAPLPIEAERAASTTTTTTTITLATALALSARGSADIIAASAEVDALAGEASQAGARPNPSLELLREGVGGGSGGAIARATSVQLAIPIELGGKRQARVALADANVDVGRQLLGAVRARVRADTVAAYHAAFLAGERVQLAQAAQAIASASTHAASRRVDAGKASPVEATRAQVAAASVDIELLQARRDQALALNALRALLPADGTVFDAVAAPVASVPALPVLADLLARVEHAPALAAARLEIARRSALARVELARRTPDISLIVGVKREQEGGQVPWSGSAGSVGSNGSGGPRHQALLGLSLPLPLFDRNDGAVLASQRRLAQARERATSTSVLLRAELTQAHLRLAAALEEVALLDQRIVPGARRAHAAAARGFEAGKFSMLEVLDAQRSLIDSQRLALKARADAHRAAADLAIAMPPLDTP